MHLVASGKIERTYRHLDTSEEAALLFVEVEAGPFGELTLVTYKDEDRFFHTETLLQKVEDNNQKILTLLDEETT